jgi:DNA-binding transcriptional LysR family regulator
MNVRKLEAHYRQPLLDYDGKRLNPTVFGARVLEESAALIALHDRVSTLHET